MLLTFIILGILLYAFSLVCLIYLYKPKSTTKQDNKNDVSEKNKWALYLGWATLAFGAAFLLYGIPHDIETESHLVSSRTVYGLVIIGVLISILGIILYWVVYKPSSKTSSEKNRWAEVTGLSLVIYGLAIAGAYPVQTYTGF
jgi:hypothetical protein